MQEQHFPSRLHSSVQGMPAQGNDSLITHADIKRFLKRYSSILKWSTAIGILLAGAYAWTATPLYTAHTQIIIDPSLPQALINKTDNLFAIDNAQVESQIEVIRSENIAQAVVKKHNLTEDPYFSAVPTSILNLPFQLLYGQQQFGQAARERLALAHFENGLDVRRVGLSYTIDIYYSAPRPDLAAALANATAEAYVADQINARGQAARQGGLWLEERIDHLRQQMNTASLQAQELRAKRDYRISPRGEGGAPTPAAAATNQQNTLEELDSTAQTFRRIYESYLSAYTESVQRQSYPVSNARVITTATAPTGKSYPRTKFILVFGAMMGALAGFGIAFVRAKLDRTVVNARQIRDELGLECLAMVPSFIERRSAVFGGAMGQRRSLLRRAAASLGRRLIAPFKRSSPEASIEANRDGFTWVVALPFSVFSQTMKRLKTALALAARGRQLRTIAVTSTLPGEGKSTVASNLAALFAGSGVRTLLVDSDMRRASLSRAFVPNAECGLQEVIDRTRTLDDCIVHIADARFHMLPLCLAGLSQAADAAPSVEEIEPFLAEMQKSYDIVIFELPPISASLESLAVSSLVDGTVVVAEWEHTPLPLLAESVHLLRNAGAKITGIVINKIDTATVDRTDLASNYYAYSYAPANVEHLR